MQIKIKKKYNLVIMNKTQMLRILDFVRFQVLTLMSMKMAVFGYVAPCSLVDTDSRFRGAYCLYHQGDE
jgi:hypothetical protein